MQRLDALKAAGTDTLIDVTVVPIGRSARRIKQVAERTRLNIIVATGVYALDELPAPLEHAAWTGSDH